MTVSPQALQKLQEKVARLESVSAEATKAAQAESASSAHDAARRHAQTDRILEGMLAFKEAHQAQQAKHGADISALQSIVAQLQPPLLSQSPPQGNLSLGLQQERSVTDTQCFMAPAVRLSTSSVTTASGLSVRPRSAQGHRPVIGAGQTASKAVNVGSKGRVRLSLDGKGKALRAAERATAAALVGGQQGGDLCKSSEVSAAMWNWTIAYVTATRHDSMMQMQCTDASQTNMHAVAQLGFVSLTSTGEPARGKGAAIDLISLKSIECSSMECSNWYDTQVCKQVHPI